MIMDMNKKESEKQREKVYSEQIWVQKLQLKSLKMKQNQDRNRKEINWLLLQTFETVTPDNSSVSLPAKCFSSLWNVSKQFFYVIPFLSEMTWNVLNQHRMAL